MRDTGRQLNGNELGAPGRSSHWVRILRKSRHSMRAPPTPNSPWAPLLLWGLRKDKAEAWSGSAAKAEEVRKTLRK